MQLSRSAKRVSGTPGIMIGVAVALGAMATFNYAMGRRAERRNPPSGRFVQIEGVRLHYVERGEGPPVILLHGNGAMVEDFVISGVLDRLSRHHRVIAFDRPGFGHSDRPRDRVWSAAEQARLIRAALRLLDVRQPIILGHSWGTMVALEMALARPDDTAGLALVSGYYFPTLRLDVPLLSPPAIPVVGDVLRYTISPLLGWLLAPLIFRKLFGPAPVTRDFRSRFPLAMALRPWQIRASAGDTALMVPGAAALAGRYAELEIPVTIIGAPGDRIVDHEAQAGALHHTLPHSDLARIEDAGHMLHHTRPEAVVSAITEMAAALGQRDASPAASG